MTAISKIQTDSTTFFYGNITDYDLIPNRPYFLKSLLIVICQRGIIKVSTNFTQVELTEGNMGMFLSRTVFILEEYSEDAEVAVIVFPQEFIDEICIERDLFPVIPVITLHPQLSLNNDSSLSLVIDTLIHLIKGDEISHDRLSFIYGVKLMMARLRFSYARKFDIPEMTRGRSKQIFTDFVFLLHQNFTKTRRISFYASKLGVTPQHLNRILKRYTGRSTKQMIEKILHIEACFLIRFTNVPLKEISLRLGFSEFTNFNKWFAKISDMPPAAFREKYNIYY